MKIFFRDKYVLVTLKCTFKAKFMCFYSKEHYQNWFNSNHLEQEIDNTPDGLK